MLSKKNCEREKRIQHMDVRKRNTEKAAWEGER
jgi:hypothetical protein